MGQIVSYLLPFKRLSSIIFTTLFFIIISTPLIIWLTGIPLKPVYINENRNLAKLDFTDKKLKEYPLIFETYINDNIPMRTQIIKSYRTVFNAKLKSSSAGFTAGLNGEFFVQDYVNAYLGWAPLPEELLENMRLFIVGYHYFFKAHGADFYYVLIPNKETYMNEFIPKYLRDTKKTKKKGGGYRLSYVEQISKLLENDTFLNYIDIDKEYRKENSKDRLYYERFDMHHWNGYGRELATKIILDKMAVKNKKYNFDELKKYYEIYHETVDLDIYETESIPKIRHLEQDNFIDIEDNFTRKHKDTNWHSLISIENFLPNKERAMFLFSDSYFKSSSANFYKSTPSTISLFAYATKYYLHARYNDMLFDDMDGLIARYKPDSVVFAMVERSGIPLEAYHSYLKIIADAKLKNFGTLITASNIKKFKKDNDGSILLPKIKLSAEGSYIISAYLFSKVAGEFKIFYRYEGEEFSNDRQLTLPIIIGKNSFREKLKLAPDKELYIKILPSVESKNITYLDLPELNYLEEK